MYIFVQRGVSGGAGRPEWVATIIQLKFLPPVGIAGDANRKSSIDTTLQHII